MQGTQGIEKMDDLPDQPKELDKRMKLITNRQRDNVIKAKINLTDYLHDAEEQSNRYQETKNSFLEKNNESFILNISGL